MSAIKFETLKLDRALEPGKMIIFSVIEVIVKVIVCLFVVSWNPFEGCTGGANAIRFCW